MWIANILVNPVIYEYNPFLFLPWNVLENRCQSEGSTFLDY